MLEKFDLIYINEYNEKVCFVVIYRVVFGLIDCFFGILIEYFGGVFLVWFVLIQV